MDSGSLCSCNFHFHLALTSSHLKQSLNPDNGNDRTRDLCGVLVVLNLNSSAVVENFILHHQFQQLKKMNDVACVTSTCKQSAKHFDLVQGRIDAKPGNVKDLAHVQDGGHYVLNRRCAR